MRGPDLLKKKMGELLGRAAEQAQWPRRSPHALAEGMNFAEGCYLANVQMALVCTCCECIKTNISMDPHNLVLSGHISMPGFDIHIPQMCGHDCGGKGKRGLAAGGPSHTMGIKTSHVAGYHTRVRCDDFCRRGRAAVHWACARMVRRKGCAGTLWGGRRLARMMPAYP